MFRTPLVIPHPYLQLATLHTDEIEGMAKKGTKSKNVMLRNVKYKERKFVLSITWGYV